MKIWTTDKKGFSLIELLIVIAIFGMILSSVYTVFNTFFKDYKVESRTIEAQIESVVNTNLIKVDLIHAGFGLADDTDDKPFVWDDSNRKLTIKSVFNATNSQTDGWCLVDCSSGSWNKLSGDNFTSGDSMVYLNCLKEFVSNGVFGTCPTNDIVIGFPYDDNVSGCTSSQFCSIITYSLSSSQTIEYCNPNTRNLLRRAGGNAINNTSGSRVIECVSDFMLTFDYDSDGDGLVEDSEKDINIPSSDNASLIKKRVKAVNFYLLFHEGKVDPNYTFSGDIDGNYLIFKDLDSDGSCDTDDVCLNLPSNYINYRWKKLYLKVTPRGSISE